MDLQLDEVRAEGFAGELCREHGFLSVAYTRRIGQQLNLRTAYMHEHVVLRVIHVDALHCYGDHLRFRSGDCAGHQFVGAEFSRSYEQARTERPSADN